MATTYTVKWGDTLTAIAAKYNTTVNALVKLNNIADPDFIVVGQVLKLSGTATSAAKNTSSKAVVTTFGLQTNTTNVVYAVWTWDKTNTNNYQIKWEYNTGDGVWFIGSESTVTAKQSTYSAPSNAKSVRFRVKPVSKTKKVNNKDVSYWTASWSDAKSYSFSKNPPTAPPKPSVTIDKSKLTVKLSDLGSLNASIIQFDIAKNDAPSYKTAKVAINKTASVNYECAIELGARYKARCRAIKNDVYSDWSPWSEEETTIPKAPSEITECRVGSDDESVIVKWKESTTATSYEVQYTATKNDFSSDTPTDIKTVTVETTTCTITDIETGKEYFVRVRAKNAKGESDWTAVSSTVLGKGPSAPTTWSSTVTAVVGEPVTLYWQHNSEDSSDATYADLELYMNGVKTVVPTFDYTKDDGSVETEVTKSYAIDTSQYTQTGAQLQWRVRTAGATKSFGEWSILRVIDIYARPELELIVTDVNENSYSSKNTTSSFDLTSFPIYLTAISGPGLQKAIGYQVKITSNEDYETIDNLGNRDSVIYGEAVYSRYFDALEEDSENAFKLTISAGDMNLDPNISYTISCTVSMNSGLSAEASLIFLTNWVKTTHTVNAEIGIDNVNLTASIKPYCLTDKGEFVEDILLFVYRREYDGKLVEIGSDIVNGSETFVTDPHPSLDYARYRIVAMDKSTGSVSYNDIPGYYVGCKSVILQWDEQWTNFDASDGSFDEPEWSGSLLKLPYNVDVSDKQTPDVSMIKYIGREHPVSYYGTQLGSSATWNVAIDKSDKETLYALRRLAKWLGNVYVREPSGSGYWANVSVSFSQKHLDLTIPVTLSVTRVEGGI